MTADTTLQPLPYAVKVAMLCVAGFMLTLLVNLDRRYRQSVIFGKSLSFKRRLLASAFVFCFIVALGAFSSWHAFNVLFVFVMLLGAFEMLGIIRQSAKDVSTGKSVFGKVASLSGWTHSDRVATGQRDLAFSIPIILLFYAVLGFFTVVALWGVTNA